MKTFYEFGLYATRYAHIAIAIFCSLLVLALGAFLIFNPEKFI